ncbi:hypothetical protein [Sporofaciens musculi]|uniref:hypothetical protein n=1 Tax=Sporofaciens musculi TaxID=2681861 RepID=UPI002570472B|nr:hypothetical protein [Sporofaciens musculi]
MRKVEHYICELCGTEYAEQRQCEICENSHKQPLRIVKANYNSNLKDETGFPVSIDVEFGSGKSGKIVTYQRKGVKKG